MKPLFATIPHSGERVPDEVTWLKGLSEAHLMCDVDRFVDRLYRPSLEHLKIPFVLTQWHRYVVDLNRLPEDIDGQSVIGSANKAGTFTSGLHWVKTTTDLPLMDRPISQELHDLLVRKYFEPFHQQVRDLYAKFRASGAKEVYHVDLHSMPSRGTTAHRDPGQTRAEIVISDFNGKSCEAKFKDLVIKSYESEGFKVAYNWPYIGGRVTQQYGHPDQGQHAIQVELRRDLYMDESSKRLKPGLEKLESRLGAALALISEQI